MTRLNPSKVGAKILNPSSRLSVIETSSKDI
jgi:hypothetical protein